MLCTSFLNIDKGRSFTHIIFMALSSLGRDVMAWFLLGSPFIIDQMFSMGFRSGELPGQSIMEKLCWHSNTIDNLLVWQGAPSCRNLVTPCISIQGNNFSLSTVMYIWLFMVVWGGGRKKREPLPFLQLKQPHTITLRERFTFVTTDFCLYWLIVNALLTFIDLGLMSQNVDSLLKMTFSQLVSVQAW
jgi:hypothetical protein